VSSTIWTQDALSSSAVRMRAKLWRVVEAQHRVSTMKLVDSLAEQEILEEILESTKPPVPEACRDLDYLLFTPFRYGAAYPAGSRFRRAGFTEGVFYASASPDVAMTEMAFYRLLFFAESPETPIPKNAADYTALAVRIASERALDLTKPPLNAHSALWMKHNDYTDCQALADGARAVDVTAIRYASVRDHKHRPNYAVLSCRAFADRAPIARQSWKMHIRAEGVLAICEAPAASLTLTAESFKDDERILPFLTRKAL